MTGRRPGASTFATHTSILYSSDIIRMARGTAQRDLMKLDLPGFPSSNPSTCFPPTAGILDIPPCTSNVVREMASQCKLERATIIGRNTTFLLCDDRCVLCLLPIHVSHPPAHRLHPRVNMSRLSFEVAAVASLILPSPISRPCVRRSQHIPYRMERIALQGIIKLVYATTNYPDIKRSIVHTCGTLYTIADQNGFNSFNTHCVPLRTNPRMQLKASHLPRLH